MISPGWTQRQLPLAIFTPQKETPEANEEEKTHYRNLLWVIITHSTKFYITGLKSG